MINQNWKSWVSADDLPRDVRKAIHRGAVSPLLNSDQAEHMRQTLLETFSRAFEILLKDNELKWMVEVVSHDHPDLPREAIFRAVALEVGVTVSKVRELWFKSRRNARIKDLVLRSLRGDV